MEVEDDVDEEEDVDNRVNDEHLDISAATGRPEGGKEPGLVGANLLYMAAALRMYFLRNAT